jgi:hypothetical protein
VGPARGRRSSRRLARRPPAQLGDAIAELDGRLGQIESGITRAPVRLRRHARGQGK